MLVTFRQTLADEDDFPKADLRVHPSTKTAFTRMSILRDRQPGLFDRVVFTRNGRSALGLVCMELGIGPGDRILLPAYHCPAMAEPFIWSGAQIEFYRVTADLSVDLDDLAAKLPQAKACVLVRYFGFPQNLRTAAQLSNERQAIVIEDCAHSFFSLDGTAGLDPVSDVAIFSLSKFFPTTDGGAIRFTRHEFRTRMHAQPNLSEARALFQFLGISNPMSWLKHLFKPRPVESADAIAGETATYRYFDPNEVAEECFRHTEWLVRHGDFRRIAEERRANFRFLLTRLTGSRIGTPLFKTLPDTVVPYVFPFLLRDESDFDVIRLNGLAASRWEEFARSDCATSESYRARLVHLPCSQGLSKSALSQIVNIIESIEGKR